ncbi:MAG: DUF2069 domain-containing protein [Comamonas sp.]|jgi:uncharacterized membrane protein|uniref:DUF2069 domain-containing protein n=1 Tax=Comamonas denitrificans TaxID=117506 RepID=UPI001B55F2CB|nr:DUF2069 domain-containing protein [Comamonas sp.]MBP8226276.1 DUF2069 domain-containing protein [Acidovorax sp.]HRL38254.1 DUF2069 domain-containing protein [Comamonas denitrificans]MBP6293335.1 DUF2069 domain-containing protein [Comamonas sp.]MBP7855452.1 DUF2069 domain-containing protein [Comamonas sp.]
MTSSAPPPFSALPRHAQVTQIAAVSSLVALIVLCVAWELWLAPVRPGGSLLALKALPLVLPLPGLLKRRMYTYRWLSLMIWLYCTEGLVRATSDTAPSSYYAWAEVVLCILLFTACTLHIRLRLKAAKTMQQQA